MSKHLARLFERQARQSAEQFFRIAVTEVAEKVDAVLSVGKEAAVEQGFVESGHGSAVEPDGTRGQQEVAGLQGRVAQRRALCELGVVGETVVELRVVRKEFRRLFVEPGVVGGVSSFSVQ